MRSLHITIEGHEDFGTEQVLESTQKTMNLGAVSAKTLKEVLDKTKIPFLYSYFQHFEELHLNTISATKFSMLSLKDKKKYIMGRELRHPGCFIPYNGLVQHRGETYMLVDLDEPIRDKNKVFIVPCSIREGEIHFCHYDRSKVTHIRTIELMASHVFTEGDKVYSTLGGGFVGYVVGFELATNRVICVSNKDLKPNKGLTPSSRVRYAYKPSELDFCIDVMEKAPGITLEPGMIIKYVDRHDNIILARVAKNTKEFKDCPGAQNSHVLLQDINTDEYINVIPSYLDSNTIKQLQIDKVQIRISK